jgi:hypothetical protein
MMTNDVENVNDCTMPLDSSRLEVQVYGADSRFGPFVGSVGDLYDKKLGSRHHLEWNGVIGTIHKCPRRPPRVARTCHDSRGSAMPIVTEAARFDADGNESKSRQVSLSLSDTSEFGSRQFGSRSSGSCKKEGRAPFVKQVFKPMYSSYFGTRQPTLDTYAHQILETPRVPKSSIFYAYNFDSGSHRKRQTSQVLHRTLQRNMKKPPKDALAQSLRWSMRHDWCVDHLPCVAFNDKMRLRALANDSQQSTDETQIKRLLFRWGRDINFSE